MDGRRVMTEKDLTEIHLKMDQWAAQCDGEFVVRLIDTFLADAPKRLSALRRAFEQSAQVELKRAAHTLKSSSGQLGITFYAEVAKSVELAAVAGGAVETAEPVQWLEDQFPDISAELQKLRGRFADAGASSV